MVLPHDVRLAAENALKSLKADALKVSAKGGAEALRAAEAAQMEGQLPLALGDSTDPDSNRTRGHAALLHRSTDRRTRSLPCCAVYARKAVAKLEGGVEARCACSLSLQPVTLGVQPVTLSIQVRAGRAAPRGW